MTIRLVYEADCDECAEPFGDRFGNNFDDLGSLREEAKRRGWVVSDNGFDPAAIQIVCPHCKDDR